MSKKGPTDSDQLKQLKIKTGVVRRIVKERTSYIEEAQKKEVEVEGLVAKNEDSHVIKKQREVLAESQMMVPDCTRRLDKAAGDLDMAIQQCSADAHIRDGADFGKAKEALAEAKAVLEAANAAQ